MSEIKVENWNTKDIPHTAFIDSDGDVGLMDNDDYSIMLSPKGARDFAKFILKQAKGASDE